MINKHIFFLLINVFVFIGHGPVVKDGKKKIIDYIKSSNPDFVSAQEYIDSGVPINQIPTNSGLFNSSLPKPQFGYTPPPGASKTAQVRDSYIVMGQVLEAAESLL